MGEGPLYIRMEERRQTINFYYKEGDSPEKKFDVTADGAEINPEEIGGMIGTMIGMFATANGEESTNTAAFDYFEMK